MNETIVTLNALLVSNISLFSSLPRVPTGETSVLDVSAHGCRILWTGREEDILGTNLDNEAKVQLKCLCMQAKQRDDSYRGWTPILFLTSREEEQSLHRILLKPGEHQFIAAIGGCDCPIMSPS